MNIVPTYEQGQSLRHIKFTNMYRVFNGKIAMTLRMV